MYKINKSSGAVIEVKCVKQTEKSVWIEKTYQRWGDKKEVTSVDRCLKNTSYEIYIEDREEAYNYAISKMHDKADYYEKLRDRFMEQLDKLRKEL